MKGKIRPKTYTVVALYRDNFQRYAVRVRAINAYHAETEAQRHCRAGLNWNETDGDPLVIAAVIEGKVRIVA